MTGKTDLRAVIADRLNAIVGPDKRVLLEENAALRRRIEELEGVKK